MRKVSPNLSVVARSSLVRHLAVQAEQRRLLQGESSGHGRLLQRVEGILLAAAHRECRGHEAFFFFFFFFFRRSTANDPLVLFMQKKKEGKKRKKEDEDAAAAAASAAATRGEEEGEEPTGCSCVCWDY